MKSYICTTCGTQYAPSKTPPDFCNICKEERQYVNPTGQKWTTLSVMKNETYENVIQMEEKNLYSLKTRPNFAIAQTAYFVKSEGFNLLWDCVSYLDDATLNELRALGGIDAIALSHPHYYSSQVEWAEAFQVPIYIHEDDKEWVNRESERIQFWSGESLKLKNGVTIHRLGGHFKGGCVLHWEKEENEKGVLLTGDIIQVVADHNWVSFMYSYPNLIPLPISKVEEIALKVTQLNFDRIYNAFHNVVASDAKHVVQRSAERYISAINGTLFNT